VIVWIDEREVRAMHLELIADHGGSAGMRDAGLLESALARPQNIAAYGNPTLYELAAAYAFGLTRNRAFIDGNKRIAFAAMAVFLEVNGYELTAPQVEAYEAMLGLAAGEMTEVQLAAWLQKHVRPRE
jgi:death on curing protein